MLGNCAMLDSYETLDNYALFGVYAMFGGINGSGKSCDIWDKFDIVRVFELNPNKDEFHRVTM